MGVGKVDVFEGSVGVFEGADSHGGVSAYREGESTDVNRVVSIVSRHYSVIVLPSLPGVGEDVRVRIVDDMSHHVLF